MIKKGICFILITVVVAVLIAIFSNIAAIGDTIMSVPKDRIIAYLLGALSMLFAQVLANKLSSSKEE